MFLTRKLCRYFQKTQNIDLLDFNKFIFRYVIVHIFKKENIIPFIIATCVIFTSILIFEAEFIFIPQSSLPSFVSFFVFVLATSMIAMAIYPLIVMLLINLIGSFWHKNSFVKSILMLLIIFLSFILGIVVLSGPRATLEVKVETFIVWVGCYFILVEMYLTYLHNNSLLKMGKSKYLVIVIIAVLITHPLSMVALHSVQVMNFTTVNPQTYLAKSNCDLLKNLDGKYNLPDDNSILNDPAYFRETSDKSGCEIYNNVIRFSFATDYVLMIKKNIHPIIATDGQRYNEYVRLNCYSGYCYTENYIFFNADNDINEALIQRGYRYKFVPRTNKLPTH